MLQMIGVQGSKTDGAKCPACSTPFFYSTTILMERPLREGDIAVCQCCAQVMTFGANLQLQQIEPDAAPDHVRVVLQEVRMSILARHVKAGQA